MPPFHLLPSRVSLNFASSPFCQIIRHLRFTAFVLRIVSRGHASGRVGVQAVSACMGKSGWSSAEGSGWIAMIASLLPAMRADEAAFIRDVSLVGIKCESCRASHEHCVGREFAAPLEYVLCLRAKQSTVSGTFFSLLLLSLARCERTISLHCGQHTWPASTCQT